MGKTREKAVHFFKSLRPCTHRFSSLLSLYPSKSEFSGLLSYLDETIEGEVGILTVNRSFESELVHRTVEMIE